MPAFFKIAHTVDGATAMPRPASSPAIRRYPQASFSFAIRSTRALMFRRVAGRPLGLDLAAHRRRRMSRRHCRIVPGVTISRSLWCRAFGIRPSRSAMSARSAQDTFGRTRSPSRRCTTASW